MSIPKEGEIWVANRQPVTFILRPQGTKKYLLATLQVAPGQKPITRNGLSKYLSKHHFEKVGAFG